MDEPDFVDFAKLTSSELQQLTLTFPTLALHQRVTVLQELTNRLESEFSTEYAFLQTEMRNPDIQEALASYYKPSALTASLVSLPEHLKTSFGKRLLAEKNCYFVRFLTHLESETELKQALRTLEQICKDQSQREQIVQITQVAKTYLEANDLQFHGELFEKCLEELLVWRVENGDI